MKRKKPTYTPANDGTRKARIYIRVSTAEQADSGLSLEAQERKCRNYCELNEWDVAGVYVDAVTAKNLQRPKLEALLVDLQPGEVLVALKMDRLTRSVADLAPLAERIDISGAEWACVQERYDTSTATGRLMLRLVVELSQWEREVIAERTAAALAEKRERGERLGTIPLGYRRNEAGALVEDPEEMATVRRARELRAAGKTLEEIARTLTAEKRRTKRGGRWQRNTVNKLLRTRYLEGLAAG